MNYEDHQELAKSQTAQLLFYLAVGTIGVVFTTSVAASMWFYARVSTTAGRNAALVAAMLTLGAIILSSISKGAQIRHGGGEYLAASMGGYPIDLTTKGPSERQLVNIVEEIAVASGLPVPTLFILHDEMGINAFAAGWNADNAVIGVTRGALVYLTRDELQAVIAHEFSHVANGDMKVKTRIIAWVYGIGSLSTMGRGLLRFIPRSGANGAALAMFGGAVVLMVLGAIGGWFASLMQAAVNREREHLADASAVQYTRDSESLANALKKIAALGSKNEIQAAHASEAAHLFFETPFSRASKTHPPLHQRIAALSPAWDGSLPDLAELEDRAGKYVSITHLGHALPDLVGGVAAPVTGPLAEATNGVGEAIAGPLDNIVETAVVAGAFGASSDGQPSDAHLHHARRILDEIPSETRTQLHTPEGAVAAVLGLLISPLPEHRERELGRAVELTGFPAEVLVAGSTIIGSLDRRLRLPAIDIALASVRRAPDDVQDLLRETISDFTASSPDADLFRWMLRRSVLRHLEDSEAQGTIEHHRLLVELPDEASLVYAALAAYNSAGDAQVGRAYLAAHEAAGLERPEAMPHPSHLTVARLDVALDALAEMNHDNRFRFVTGAIAAAELDGAISADEAALVRVVADSVRMAMPPLLPTMSDPVAAAA